jgi:hypothetical protein
VELSRGAKIAGTCTFPAVSSTFREPSWHLPSTLSPNKSKGKTLNSTLPLQLFRHSLLPSPRNIQHHSESWFRLECVIIRSSFACFHPFFLSPIPTMAPSHTPRHVRRAPLAERLRAWIHPAELYMWASEELSSHDWDEFSKKWSNTIGISLNLLFIFTRINSTRPSNGSDIFADYDHSSSGVFSWLVRAPPFHIGF